MLILALAAALLYGSADFLGGVASRRAHPVAVIAVTMPAGGVVVLAVTLLGTLSGGGAGSGAGSGAGGGGAGGGAHGGGVLGALGAAAAFGGWGGLAWAMAGGVAGAIGLVAFYSGFARAPMSVVAPVSALVSTVLPVGVAIAGGERPTAMVIGGAVACLAAIVLVSVEPGSASAGRGDGRSRLRGVAYGGFAGASFGLFFLFLKYAGHSAVLWPVTVQRLTGSVLALLALALVRPRIQPLWRRDPDGDRADGADGDSTAASGGRRLLGIALVSGAVDATANVCYILATRAGDFGLAVVLTSLYPGATVLLARFVLRERIRAVQQAGLILALAGIVLVTA